MRVEIKAQGWIWDVFRYLHSDWMLNVPGEVITEIGEDGVFFRRYGGQLA